MDLDPGWKPDPTKRYPERYWDGLSWSDRVRDGDNEVNDRFEMAMKTPLGGTPPPPGLHQRPLVRLVVAVTVLAGLVALVLGPVRGLLDGVPGTARAADPSRDGLIATAEDIADAATDTRWTIVTAFYPDEVANDPDRASRVAGVLRACFGDQVSQARRGESAVATPATLPGPGETATVEVVLTPRPDQLAVVSTLTLRLRHDGTRWTLLDPVAYSVGDADRTPCTGLAE